MISFFFVLINIKAECCIKRLRQNLNFNSEAQPLCFSLDFISIHKANVGSAVCQIKKQNLDLILEKITFFFFLLFHCNVKEGWEVPRETKTEIEY